MKTHIALVGSQPIPVFLGIQSSGSIDKLILVHSEQTINEAMRLKAYFHKVASKIVICNPVNLEEIEACAQDIYEEVKEDEIVVDLTSGTKGWSLVFYRTFLSLNKANFILVDQNNRIQNLHTHEESVGTINTELRFMLYGTPIGGYTRFTDYTDEDKEECKKVEKCRRKYLYSFSELTVGVSLEYAMDKHVVSKKNPVEGLDDIVTYVEWDKMTHTVNLHLYDSKNNEYEDFEFCSPHIMSIVFNSGWFELKTAMELNERVSNTHEIWMNCEFLAKGDLPKNEIDIIADMGNKLLFVECKTKVFDITAIDKFSSAIRNYSGTSSKGIFVVDYVPNKERAKYEVAVGKCKDNGISIFCFGERDQDPFLPSLDDIINNNLNKTNKR